MIILNKITKIYNDNMIFDNFSLSIENNSLLSIIGKSGCGKSTFLYIIGGLENVNSGEVIVDDYIISNKYNKLKYYRNKVGFLLQNFALIENYTVYENLQIIKKRYRENFLSIDDSLKKVGLYDKKYSKVYTLSGGEQQRIALARLMIKKCDVVLADEPTGSLDKTNSEIVFEILKSLNTDFGKTVIIVTHDLALANKCNRIIKLD